MATQSNIDWQYLNNQFANALGDSYADTNIFGTDHLSKLRNMAGDADIDVLILRTEAVYVSYQTAYTAWQKSTAFWKGATNKVDSLIEELLRVKLPRFDILIQVLYSQDTEEYITLFPQGRTAFREVGKDGKIQLLTTFVDTLADYADLAAVYTEATAVLAALTTARDRQQQREQSVRDAATNLREAQGELFTVLYKNLGILIDKYGDAPDQILNFFAVEMIRTTSRKKKIDETAAIAPEDDTTGS
jgi:hypothetical protein